MDTEPRKITDAQIETLIDLSRIVMSELELRRLATTDGLTGALARRAFRDELTRTTALALRHRHDLSCIMFDLDHFKAVNDAHGHATGDIVLTDAVRVCRDELRTSDPIGRMGGEEFAVLLPHTGAAAALLVAEKLRAAIARLRIATLTGPIGATASFGVATLSASIDSADALLQQADAALYAAKSDGRNRCVASQPVRIVEQAVQRRVLKAGRIAFNGGRSSIDCTVRSLSEDGAAMRVDSTAGVPGTFKLLIEADNFSRLCSVLTKSDQQLAVRFV